MLGTTNDSSHAEQVSTMVSFMSCSHKDLGSNIGWDIDYTEWCVLCFSSVSPGRCQD
jgi:hypothetical protein